MKTLFWAVLCSMALGIVGYACSDDDSGGDSDSDSDSDVDADGVCEDWCNAYVAVLGDCLDEIDCWLVDENAEEQICENTCKDSFDDLTSDDRQEAYDCLKCHLDEAGSSPDCFEWDDACSDCDDICDQNGAQNLFNDFYFEPDTECAGDGSCSDIPTSCTDLVDPEYGCCYENVVYFCDDGVTLESIDCSAEGKTCEYNSAEDYMDCI